MKLMLDKISVLTEHFREPVNLLLMLLAGIFNLVMQGNYYQSYFYFNNLQYF